MNTKITVLKSIFVMFTMTEMMVIDIFVPKLRMKAWEKIVEIRRDDSDHFFGVLMDNDEIGFMKSARIKMVFRRSL